MRLNTMIAIFTCIQPTTKKTSKKTINISSDESDVDFGMEIGGVASSRQQSGSDSGSRPMRARGQPVKYVFDDDISDDSDF